MRAAHHIVREVREAYRINAVILLGQGWKVADVAAALFIDPDTARGYMSSPMRLYTFFLNNSGRFSCQSFSACTGEMCPNARCGIW